MKLAVLALSSAVLAASAAVALHGPAAAASGGVSFTAAQVALGAKAYTQNCLGCHGAQLQGVSGPKLIGKTSGIAQQTVVEVYEYVSQQMPMTAPGSLSKAQYVGIMAYILQKNGHKASGRALTESEATTSSTTILAH